MSHKSPMLENNKRIFLLGGKRYKIIAKRWGILVLVSVILLLDTFSASFFGFVNDLSSAYYRVSPATTDLLSTVNMLARSMFGFVLALVGEQVNFRFLSLATSSTIIAGDLLILAGVSSRNNFIIATIGQVMNGFGATMALTVSQMAPSNWFPESERGRAVSLPWVMRRISPVISNLVATRSIKVPAPRDNFNFSTFETEDDERMRNFRSSFQLSYLSLAAVAFATFTLSQFFVKDYPPLENNEVAPIQENRPWRPASELMACLKLFTNGQYVLLFFMYVLILSIRPLTEWLLSSVVLAGFLELTDKEAGTMFCVGYSIGALGPPTGGLILDKLKKPKVTFVAGLCFIMAFCSLFAYAIYIHNFALLFFSFVCTTFFRDFCFVCIAHSFVAVMDPESASTKVRAFSISGSVPWFSLAAYTALLRLVLESKGPVFTSLIPIPFNFLAGLLYLLFYHPPQSGIL